MTRNNLRIAVVDDDVAVRQALMRLLETSSCEVQTFKSARELPARWQRLSQSA